jgi:hypothetical protein
MATIADAENKLGQILTSIQDKNVLLERYKALVKISLHIIELLTDQLDAAVTAGRVPAAPGVAPGPAPDLTRISNLITQIKNAVDNGYNVSERTNKNFADDLKNIVRVNNLVLTPPMMNELNGLNGVPPRPPVAPGGLGGVIGGRRRSRKQKKGKRRGTVKRGGWVLKGSKY